MAGTFISYFDITSDCIVAGPVPTDPFMAGSANLFPKMISRIDDDSWELWEFETFSADGSTAMGLSFYRDARGVEKGGFHAEINAIWPDGSKWSETLYFAESTVTGEGKDSPHHGRVQGIWKSKTEDNSEVRSISFTMSADHSTATVRFSVPGQVIGNLELRSSGTNPEARLPATEQAALLCPGVYYMFPMGPVVADGDVTFISSATGEAQKLSISAEKGGRGGMVRGWSSKAWPTFMNDAYYVVGHAGPYMLQLLRIRGSIFAQHKLRAVARLYHYDELVCAANQIVELQPDDLATQGERDQVQIDKVLEDEHEEQGLGGLTGEFRDANIGYRVSFVNAQQRVWNFEIRHKRALWSEPTSALGPDGTGKSGWVEGLFGGAEGETYEGMGVAGQLQIPVP